MSRTGKTRNIYGDLYELEIKNIKDFPWEDIDKFHLIPSRILFGQEKSSWYLAPFESDLFFRNEIIYEFPKRFNSFFNCLVHEGKEEAKEEVRSALGVHVQRRKPFYG